MSEFEYNMMMLLKLLIMGVLPLTIIWGGLFLVLFLIFKIAKYLKKLIYKYKGERNDTLQ